MLTIQEKQGILLSALLEATFNKPARYAIFGIKNDVVKPLILKGWIHADTYKYTGGATLTKLGRRYVDVQDLMTLEGIGRTKMSELVKEPPDLFRGKPGEKKKKAS